jgi:hypothetical protein
MYDNISPKQRDTYIEEMQSHTYKPTDTYMSTKDQGEPQRNTLAEDTSALNCYIQTKHKKTFFIHLILKASMSLYT